MTSELLVVIIIGAILAYFFLFANKSKTQPSKEKTETSTRSERINVDRPIQNTVLDTYFLPAISRNATVRVLSFSNETPESTLRGQMFATKSDIECDPTDAYNLSLALSKTGITEPLFETLISVEDYTNNEEKLVISLDRIADTYTSKLGSGQTAYAKVTDFVGQGKNYKYCVVAVK